ncbi:MAG: RluA family pseudouridine synthase [Deltaproteobacteria bacterium]|nr:RluA family pseudouridine synthase [Candidatus Anaeroferrophillus wilburensis]MBN2889654.1 RluA family pseudouridine synthase [Deltaproteobacteria bacterium]
MADPSPTTILLTYSGSEKKRLDSFLQDEVPTCSRSRIQHLIKEGLVLVGGQLRKRSYLLSGDEQIVMTIPPPEEVAAITPQQLPLKVLYEDEQVIVVDKQAGMVVHPAAGNWDGTLVNALLYHCHDLGGIGGQLRPGIVHRLDQDTSGVLVVAKNETALHHLAAQFKDHSITREYVALVYGRVSVEPGVLRSNLGRNPRDRKKMASISRGGRKAVTHYGILEFLPATTWLSIRLETGRTHQIRVHFSEAGHPLVGDQVYGKKGIVRQYADGQPLLCLRDFPRQALHAKRLGFIHPATGGYMEFEAPVPPDLQQLIETLRHL